MGKAHHISPTEFCFKTLGIVPYDWQSQSMESVAKGQPTSVVAANGSGKTARLVAPLILAFLDRYPRGQVVFTSGSFRQIEKQLWPAVRVFQSKFSDWRFMSEELRTPEGGFAIGFATDDPGKAEGWHPKIDNETDPVFIIVDEAKTVPESIFEAFDRCTAKWRLWVSSPGAPRGQFYDSHHKSRGLFWTRKVPSVECPHIPEETRDKDREKYGESHPLYRSKHLAEFTADDELMVLAPDTLAAALERQPEKDESGEIVAFCDFAAGRDENVLAVRRGNHARIVQAWQERDTVQAVRQFIRLFEAEQIRPSQIWGDCDGLGTAFVDMFAEHGWHINRFHGGQTAKNSDEYANLIGEVWQTGSMMIASGKIYLGKLDAVTFDQLTTRKSEWTLTGKLRVEDKEKMRSHGQKSPDRGDALLGCIALGAHHSGAWTAAAKVKAVTNPFKAPRAKFV